MAATTYVKTECDDLLLENFKGERGLMTPFSYMETWDTYNLDWLFDPTRVDHLPIDEQLKYYKSRNLRKVKLFKAACKIFGQPESRKRVIVAPPMKKTDRTALNNIHGNTASNLKTPIPPPKVPSEEELSEMKTWDQEEQYKLWLKERKKFRNDLENMGLNEEWLRRKQNKTAMEHRVLHRLIEVNNPFTETPPPKEEPHVEPMISISPAIHRPSPAAIKIFERFLQSNKMRLLDLFSCVDKGKNWKITRDDFKKAIRIAKIPISEVMLEDLVLSLDIDLNNELDYRELAKGMGLWKKEKIDTKKKLLNSGTLSHKPSLFTQEYGLEAPGYSELDAPENEKNILLNKRSSSDYNISPRSVPAEKISSAGLERGISPHGSRVKSALSAISSTSSYLAVPEIDLRPEQRILASEEEMVELRKRDKEALSKYTRRKSMKDGAIAKDRKDKKSMILTGDLEVDNHMKPSTMGGEMGDSVDKFRMKTHKEYNDVVQLCRERDVVLTEELLKRVLLYPADRPRSQILGKIRQPALELLSNNFTNTSSTKSSKSEQSGKKQRTGRSKERKFKSAPGRSPGKSQSPGKSRSPAARGKRGKHGKLKPIKRKGEKSPKRKRNKPSMSDAYSRGRPRGVGTWTSRGRKSTSRGNSADGRSKRDHSDHSIRHHDRSDHSIRHDDRSTESIRHDDRSYDSIRHNDRSNDSIRHDRSRDSIRHDRSHDSIRREHSDESIRHDDGINYRALGFPTKSEVGSTAEKMNLSTGKAVIRSKVNCWMTFEEYDKITRHLRKDFIPAGKSDPNAFWPGQVLDKMRLYLDNDRKSNAVFQVIHKERPTNGGYNNNLNTWPVNDSGYIQYGNIDK